MLYFPVIPHVGPRSCIFSDRHKISIFYSEEWNFITFKSFWRCCIVCLRHHAMFFLKFIESLFIYVILLMRVWEGKKNFFLGRNWTALWLGDRNLYCQGGAHRLHILSALTPGEENITSVVFWLIMHKVNWIMRTCQTSQNGKVLLI